MKTYLALFLALFSVLLLSSATTASALTITHDVSFSNKYLAFGDGIQLSGDPVAQASLMFEKENGLYLLVWGSTTFGVSSSSGEKPDGTYDFGKEVDVGVGWHGSLGDIDVDVGATYFDEPYVGTLGAEDVVYSHLKLGVSSKSQFSLATVFENYSSLPNSGSRGGNIIAIETSKAVKLSESLTWLTMVGLAYGDGGFNTSPGLFVRGSSALSYDFGGGCSVNLGVRFYTPFTSDYRETDSVLSLGFRKVFPVNR